MCSKRAINCLTVRWKSRESESAMSFAAPGKCCEYELALCSMSVFAVSRAISLFTGCDDGSKLDLYIQAQALVLSVMSSEHGN